MLGHCASGPNCAHAVSSTPGIHRDVLALDNLISAMYYQICYCVGVMESRLCKNMAQPLEILELFRALLHDTLSWDMVHNTRLCYSNLAVLRSLWGQALQCPGSLPIDSPCVNTTCLPRHSTGRVIMCTAPCKAHQANVGIPLATVLDNKQGSLCHSNNV